MQIGDNLFIMFRHRFVSVILVLLVSVLCPAACGLRAAVAGSDAPALDCCCDRLPAQDGPDVPIRPTDQSPDACFCSTPGVTLEKTDASQSKVLPQPFTSAVLDHDVLTVQSVLRASQPLGFHPPDPQRILPLLI